MGGGITSPDGVPAGPYVPGSCFLITGRGLGVGPRRRMSGWARWHPQTTAPLQEGRRWCAVVAVCLAASACRSAGLDQRRGGGVPVHWLGQPVGGRLVHGVTAALELRQDVESVLDLVGELLVALGAQELR